MPTKKQLLMQEELRQSSATIPNKPAAKVGKEQFGPISKVDEVTAAFDRMPWYKKAGTAADDIVRLLASGVSFGGLDKILGPEARQATEEASIRAGSAAIPAEIIGALASPITRTIGAGAKAITPTTKGLLPYLAKIGVGTGEGATLGGLEAIGHDQDIGTGVAMGGGLGGGFAAASPMLKYLTGFLSGKAPELYSKAFEAGSDIPSVSKAFTQGMNSKPLKEASDLFATSEAALNKNAVDITPLAQELATMRNELITPLGQFKGTNKVKKAFLRMQDMSQAINPGTMTVQEADAFRRQLDEFASSKNPEIKMLGTRLVKTIKSAVQKVEPNYEPMLENYSKAKIAADTGKKLKSFMPDPYRASILGAAIPAGAVMGVPTGLLPLLALASPKVAGKLAHTSGLLKKTLNLTPGKLGLMSQFGGER